jgi:hypothetical protein
LEALLAEMNRFYGETEREPHAEPQTSSKLFYRLEDAHLQLLAEG